MQGDVELEEKGHDGKLNAFVDAIVKRLDENKYGKKLLVFSFFSDTIDYLRERLPEVLEDRIPNFSRRAEFVSGNSTAVEDVSKRFSPNSKKAHVNKQDELDFLFATDVLSEGQNLQDAGFLVNYDLHWNPVRMIQRNGRINRLGSTYDNILIANVKPHADLEFYLKLVRRLEHKIATINNTVGNDQSILGEKENPTNTRRWTVYWITTAKPELLRLRCFYFNSVQSILVTWNIYSPHHSLAGLLAYSFNAHCCLPDISVT